MNNKRKAGSLLLAGALLVGLPFTAVAKGKPAPMKTVEYVALGDSLAAGVTPTGFIDYGYADYLANHFVANKYKLADFDNFGVPGYTSVHLKNDILKSSKIRKEIKEATHVTIDIGANDLLGKLKTDPAHATDAIAAVSVNLETILSTIDKLNPKVKVYVMGYYNPFPYYTKEQQDALLPLLKALNSQIESIAKKNRDTYVSTEAQIAKEYKEYIPNPQDIHLSTTGYKVVAAEFWKVICKKK
ncbi:hypothetical protein ELQ35_20545 [Peribacillus cavernae]|uniref:SGNH hydrolase-type esterase domain-containing protein n=1 Tax=Peribacillus cavernae TaxID=1674310 RepID=A0A3S1B135_9BACI|nr:GDSL-type esterase/lipase family protein [Peribacillus cavernae]MDQ0219752.1 bacillolysin [Peribacillus cavernae]RUQ25170.1 hypothetical protein ELQ35_20545 [Peribacillus cavernae]